MEKQLRDHSSMTIYAEWPDGTPVFSDKPGGKITFRVDSAIAIRLSRGKVYMNHGAAISVLLDMARILYDECGGFMDEHESHFSVDYEPYEPAGTYYSQEDKGKKKGKVSLYAEWPDGTPVFTPFYVPNNEGKFTLYTNTALTIRINKDRVYSCYDPEIGSLIDAVRDILHEKSNGPLLTDYCGCGITIKPTPQESSQEEAPPISK
jgi:hypothetical protein